MSETWFDENESARGSNAPTKSQKMYILFSSAAIGTCLGVGLGKILGMKAAETSSVLFGVPYTLAGGTIFGALIGLAIGAYYNSESSEPETPTKKAKPQNGSPSPR